MLDQYQEILKGEFDIQISYKKEEINGLKKTISIYEKDIEDKQIEINKWKKRIMELDVIINEFENMRNRIC